MKSPIKPIKAILAAAGFSIVVALAGAALPALAADKVVAKVNGQDITEGDLKIAEVEVGSDLGNLPEGSRRLVLVEYLIENYLFADAAGEKKLAETPEYDKRMRYWKRRALRDTYFDKTIKSTITEADARKIYDKQIKAIPAKEEVKAAHILVKTEAEAKDIIEKLNRGEDFATLAKENSLDPGSKDNGGSLGYFSKGQMVPDFEAVAFKLKKGEVSDPIKTRFGYHIIKVSDKRTTPPPAFDSLKERLMMSMMHRKAQQVAAGLRKTAKIEYIDPAIKKQAEQQTRGSGIGAAPAQ